MALIARWRFEPGANLWVDSSGNGNTLTSSGSPTSDSTWRIEGQSSAKFVAASDQYAYRTDANLSAGFPCKSGDATPVKTFTFCGWLRINTLVANAGILNKYITATASRAFRIAIGASYKMFYQSYDGTQDHSAHVHQTVLTEGGVYFWAVGYRDLDSYCSIRLRNIYANTIGTDVDAAVSGTWVGLQAGAANFTIAAGWGDSNELTGNMDDLRCYSGEYLTAAQVTQICRQSSGLAGKRLMMGGG